MIYVCVSPDILQVHKCRMAQTRPDGVQGQGFFNSTPLAQAFAANPAGDVICSWVVAEGHSRSLFLLFFSPNHSILFLGPLLPVFSMRYFACWSGLFIYHNYSKLKSWTVGSWNETKLESSNQQFWSCLILGFIEVRLNRPGALEQQPTKCMSSPLTPCVSWCLHFLSLVRFTFSFFSAALTINKKQVYADKSGFNLYIHFGAGLVQGSPVSDSIKVFQQPLWLLGPLSFFSSLGSKPWGTLFFSKHG